MCLAVMTPRNLCRSLTLEKAGADLNVKISAEANLAEAKFPS